MKEQFIHDASRAIYEEATKTLNQIVTGSKTSAVAIGLYLNLPIQVELRCLPKDIETKPKLSNLAENVSAYLKHDDKTKVMFAFYYSNEKQIPKLYKLLEDPKAGAYFAYLYAREVMRVAQNHNTFAHYSMLRPKLERTSIPVDQYLFYINAASHYSINNTLHSLFTLAKIKWTDKIFQHQFYSPAYSNSTIHDILSEVIAEKVGLTPINFPGLFFFEGIPYADHTCVNDKFDEHITDLGETIESTIREFSKGSASAPIFELGFKAVKVKTGWFNKIKTLFNRTVYYKTEDYSSSWSSLNSVYRHKFKSPSKKFEDKSLSILLTVDQSGSQSTEDLGKLLHIIKKKADKINKLHIIFYDTEIVKESIFEADDLSGNAELLADLSKRYASGGTSFIKVAKRMEELDYDPEQTVHISFSDNCQDIPEVVNQVPYMKTIENIWVCTIQNNPLPASVPGTNIELI